MVYDQHISARDARGWARGARSAANQATAQGIAAAIFIWLHSSVLSSFCRDVVRCGRIACR